MNQVLGSHGAQLLMVDHDTWQARIAQHTRDVDHRHAERGCRPGFGLGGHFGDHAVAGPILQATDRQGEGLRTAGKGPLSVLACIFDDATENPLLVWRSGGQCQRNISNFGHDV